MTFRSYMDEALAEARAAAERGEVPVGAVIVSPGGEVIARAGNRTRELNDPTAHAEVLAIRAACAAAGSDRLPGHDLYVTLEPCPMCAAAISFARIGRLYYGAADPKSGGVAQGARVFSDLARARGASAVEVNEAAQIGTFVASREFGQRAELEADAIGTIIAERAGYSALVGTEFFTRIPDPAREFLSTHPPNAARIDVVRRTLRTLGRPGA